MAQEYCCFLLVASCMLVYFTSGSDGCFITNCPPGGKRSLISSLGANSLRRECTRCGPALSGRCFGPNICCSPVMGCAVGGPVAARCALEAYSSQLCFNPGPSCANGKGVCALNSTCCTSDGCFTEKACASAESTLQEPNLWMARLE